MLVKKLSYLTGLIIQKMKALGNSGNLDLKKNKIYKIEIKKGGIYPPNTSNAMCISKVPIIFSILFFKSIAS